MTRNAQQFLSLIVRRAHAIKQTVLSARLAWDTSKTARVLAGERNIGLHDLCGLVAALDIGMTHAAGGETVIVPAAHYRALRQLAAERLAVEP